MLFLKKSAIARAISHNYSEQVTVNEEYLIGFLKRLNGEKEEQGITTVSSYKYLAFLIGSCAGLFYAFFDGLDGIVSILQLMNLNPILNLILITCFTALSLLVFIGFDISETAANMGITSDNKNNSRLDDIVEQKKLLQQIVLLLDKKILQTDDMEQLVLLQQEITRLSSINQDLNSELATISNSINSVKSTLLFRYAAMIMCALLFMSFGFFTGQAGVLFLLGDITIQKAMEAFVTATITMAVSTIAAFGCTFFYWTVQKPGVDNLICKTFYGVDLEQLEEMESDNFQKDLSDKLDDKSALASQKKSLIEQAKNAHSPLSSFSIFSQKGGASGKAGKSQQPAYASNCGDITGTDIPNAIQSARF